MGRNRAPTSIFSAITNRLEGDYPLHRNKKRREIVPPARWKGRLKMRLVKVIRAAQSETERIIPRATPVLSKKGKKRR